MPPCQNCNEGYISVIREIVQFSSSIKDEQYYRWYVNELCVCCKGDYKNCPNCHPDIPNQVEAVMDGNG